MKRFNRAFTVLVFVFLYLPIGLLVVSSFNQGKDMATWSGFTTNQYVELFRDSQLIELMLNSLLIAVLSALIATALGTMAALGLHSMKGKLRSVIMSVTNIPLTNPDIVTGVSLALLFAFVGVMLKINAILGFWTILIAHITFNLPYVILSVLPKLAQMDVDLRDAALDLGCTPMQAFFKVILHEISPGIVAGGLMAFTMSLDDFVISYFVTGSSFVTLPVELYNITRKPIHPKIYALFTIMFLLILFVMVMMNILQTRSTKHGKRLIK